MTVISASRRTDIPAFYAPWLVRRLQEGYALVRNPRNPRRVTHVPLDGARDALVLWTKNPLPLLPLMDALQSIPYYIQFTLTPYDAEIEPGLPAPDRLVTAFQLLAERLGAQRLVWRYDPILFSPRYTPDVHARCFAQLAGALAGCTDTCVLSFLDAYRCCAPALRRHALRAPTPQEILPLMQRFSDAAARHGIALRTCCEAVDLSALDIYPGRCIDPERLERIAGRPFALKRDRNQRPGCGCAASVDIGAYDSCPAGCLYCYANHGAAALQRNLSLHDPLSPLLLGHLQPGDVVAARPGSAPGHDHGFA